MIRLFQILRSHFAHVAELARHAGRYRQAQAHMQEALGRIEARQFRGMPGGDLAAHGFRVFSQWDEDGIIQFLIHAVPIAQRRFVEFGVQTYEESNTRFLLRNDNWSGLVLDGQQRYIDAIKADSISWQHDLTAVSAFITRENINELLSRHGMSGEIGLLSIDIDGNDCWVWESIEVGRPAIVIVEYNAHFGATRAVAVPYDAAFERRAAHHSCIYYGASLAALHRVGGKKGYALVGCSGGGNNAFFVRDELLHAAGLRALSASEAFVAAKFREARDAAGRLTLLTPAQEVEMLRGLPVVDLETGATIPF
jgi:hypothetical protein